MHSYRIISFIADDRPGLVEEMSDVVSAHGANWLESRMSQLAGKFAGVVRLSVPPDRAGELEQALSGLDRVGLTLRFESAAAHPPPARGSHHHFEILGYDRPGILHEFAAALSQRGINVTELQSGIRRAPGNTESLFHASADIELPPGLNVAELRAALARISNALGIEYALTAVNA
jgi:glycine cleavage system regulatory protein